MKIIDYFKAENKQLWCEKIRGCDWRAAQFLAELLEKNSFNEVLGEGSLYILTDEEKIVSFAALTRKDCVDDDSLFPWIGFVFTAPEYRGQRCAGRLIDHLCQKAAAAENVRVWLATDHTGLYEKYGFFYVESRIDIYNEESRIYCRSLLPELLKNFLDSGRLTAYPSKRKMKIFAMMYLAEKFEQGRLYTEKEVNDILNSRHTFGDPATLRRELYNHRFLNRSADGGSYSLENVLPSVEELEKKYS